MRILLLYYTLHRRTCENVSLYEPQTKFFFLKISGIAAVLSIEYIGMDDM